MTLLFLVSSFADACLSSALLVHGLYPCRHNRAEVIQNFAWKVGLELLELPEEIQEKLSPSEKNYFGKHSSALQTYMAEVGIDLNVVNSLSFTRNIDLMHSEFQTNNSCCNKKIIKIVWKIYCVANGYNLSLQIVNVPFF